MRRLQPVVPCPDRCSDLLAGGAHRTAFLLAKLVIAQHQLCTGVLCTGQHSLRRTGVQHIVAVKEPDVLALCQLHAMVARSRNTTVCLLHHLHAGIRCGIFFQNVLRGIR